MGTDRALVFRSNWSPDVDAVVRVQSRHVVVRRARPADVPRRPDGCRLLLYLGLVKVSPDRPALGARRALAAALVMGISAAGLAAAQLWPMLEYQSRAFRWVGTDEPIMG
jgi:hypothetical protein